MRARAKSHGGERAAFCRRDTVRQHRQIISQAGTNFRGKRKARRLRRSGVSALEVSGLSASG